MLSPWIVTSVTWPRLTSATKSEKASVDCGPRLDEVWNRLKRATRSRPMTIHRARFLPKLFTARAFPYHLGAFVPMPATAGATPAKHRMRRQLNNCKACIGQAIHRMKCGAREVSCAGTEMAEVRHRDDSGLVP